MKYIIFAIVLVSISACSSSQRSRSSENEPDAIISRIDEMDERPDYINESEPFRIVDGKVISTGMVTIPSTDRVEAAFRIAQNNAKAAIAGAIEQRLEFIFQNAEEGTSQGSTQARYIGAESSKLITSSIKPHKNYWEKIATTTDSGERITQFRVFSTVVMPEADFKNAIFAAIRKANGKSGLSESFAKKVDAHWDQFTNNTVQSERGTASESTPNEKE